MMKPGVVLSLIPFSFTLLNFALNSILKIKNPGIGWFTVIGIDYLIQIIFNNLKKI